MFRFPLFKLIPGLALAGLILGACTADDVSDEAPLSDYDALFEGAPKGDELPVELKADGPPPREHTSLLEMQSPVKSQGSRGVCSIFATVALMEHLYMKAGMENPDFSEQYLQWSAKFEVNSFPSTSGSNAHYNLQAISQFGIPDEDAWPYESVEWGALDDPACEGESKPTRCYTNGEPPQEARDAPKYTLPAGRWLSPRREAIMDHIQVNGTGVVVGLDFFYQSWNHRKSVLPRNMDYWAQGVVLYPNQKDITESHKMRAGHAVEIVGFLQDLEFPIMDAEGRQVLDEQGNPVVEKGFFIIKNSWGTEGFGVDNPYGAGYGFLSMKYMETFGNARVTDLPELDLPGDDDGADEGDEAADGEVFSSTEVVAIPDHNADGISSTIEVPAGDAIGLVTVSVNIEHTYRGDLTVRLRRNDKVVALHQRTGGGQQNLELLVELEDFRGLDREGVWTLEVVDNARSDTGSLTGWSLTFH